MNLKKFTLQGICIFLLIGLSLPKIHAKTKDLQLLTSAGRGYTIQFSPEQFRIDTLIINSTPYHNVLFRHASYRDNAGDPMSPCRTVVLGVPYKGDVTVSMVASDFVEIDAIRLAPVPELKKKDRLPWYVYEEGASYKKAELFPGPMFETEEPAFLGHQRIIRIHINPVQFNPAKNRIVLYSKIVLRVEFSEKIEPLFPEKPDRNEEFYKKILINYEDARKWRIRPERKRLKPSRILSAGEWYKIPVTQSGLFQISGSFLKNNGINIDLIQPGTLKIYNNGGRELPRNVSETRPDSLIENPILVYGVEDNRFDESDYILFYGRSVNEWEYNTNTERFDHYINRYTDRNIYWLVFNDDKQGLRIVQTPLLSNQGTEQVSTFKDRFFLEQEINNTVNGGIQWYGSYFDNSKNSESYTVTLTDHVPSDSIHFLFRFKGESSTPHIFEIALNGSSFMTASFAGSGSSLQSGVFTGSANSGQNTLSLHYTGSGNAPRAYIDWFEVEYKRSLKASGGVLSFTSTKTGGLYDYHLSGFGSNPLVLDITNQHTIHSMELRPESGNWAFVDSVTYSGPRRYIAVQSSEYLSPASIQAYYPSGLRNTSNSADLIIVTHKDFYDQALRLKDLRESLDSLSVFVTDIQDIYDEFSWGLFDPTAIRDFIKHTFENWSTSPSYLLLFGDGDYDYRNILQYGRECRVPPFEYDGDSETGARASDDWFTYVSGNDSKMDLAVGRLPVQTVAEAKTVVDKIINYEKETLRGDWKSLVTIVGDDEKAQRGNENETTHTRASEYLAENCIPPLFNLRKIYLTEYPEEITAEGRRKPKARDELIEQINRGTLLVNFIGHGNEDLWAHERVFQRDTDMPLLQNSVKLPLFYAATCAFGWFDNPKEQSFTEELLITEEKGAICVISASRFCSAAPNEALNKAFMNRLFSENGQTLRIGDALRAAKLEVISTSNNEMYHVFGDPCMRLGSPKYRIIFNSMEPDSFKALSVIHVDGQVVKNGGTWPDFNGNLLLKGFDAKKDVTYTTQYGTKLSYKLPGNALYRGENRIQGGQFQASFIVPKDISYGGHTGRLSCYFWNDATDGGGYWDDIEVGGSTNLIDTEGPDINLCFTGHENFTSGGMLSTKPELAASINDDKSGVNITGEIGHKIILTIDGTQKEDITEYFQYNEGSYLEGMLTYALNYLSQGEHDITLKVWDNANNSSAQSLTFIIVPGDELRLENVLNYPNPFSSSTHFTFYLNQDASVEIKIYTVDGRLIKRIREFPGEPGFNMLPWDGLDEQSDPLANGVYLYKITAKTQMNGKDLTKSIIGRLMIMH